MSVSIIISTMMIIKYEYGHCSCHKVDKKSEFATSRLRRRRRRLCGDELEVERAFGISRIYKSL